MLDAVVSYRNSTSNHNVIAATLTRRTVVSYRNSTSNHNLEEKYYYLVQVVSYRNSTSNHNQRAGVGLVRRLYLIEILHQTTTHAEEQCESASLYLIEILHQTTTRPQLL